MFIPHLAVVFSARMICGKGLVSLKHEFHEVQALPFDKESPFTPLALPLIIFKSLKASLEMLS